MINDTREAGLRHEWATLQTTFENYERGGLIIKLVAVVLTALGLLTSFAPILVCFVLVVLWLQEGIWRTFQARIAARLLVVERGLVGCNQSASPDAERQAANLPVACQLHSDWSAARPGVIGLLRAYLVSSCRPTVAYPYVVLMVGVVVWVLLHGIE